MSAARPITLDEALATLRRNRDALVAAGIVHAGVFGSVARGEAGAASDLDVVVEFDSARVPGIWDVSGASLAVQDLFDCTVDVIDRTALRPGIKSRVLSETVDAF
jgi:uncharacterized protein